MSKKNETKKQLNQKLKDRPDQEVLEERGKQDTYLSFDVFGRLVEIINDVVVFLVSYFLSKEFC